MRDHARPVPDRAPRPGRRAPAPAGGVLDLQRFVGNRAVQAVLARREKPGSRVLMEGLGEIPILSVQQSQAGKDEVVLASKQGSHSADLMRAAVDGRHFESADVVLAAGSREIHYVMTGVFVSSYQPGSAAHEVESWSLSYGTMKVIQGTSGPIPG